MAFLDFLNPLKIVLDPIERIGGKIADAHIARMKAEGDKDKIAADERVKSLEMKRDVMVAELASGSRVTSWTRSLMAAPVIIFLWKVIVWDKALGQWTGGRTDALDENLWWVCTTVIAFYFLYETVRALRK